MQRLDIALSCLRRFRLLLPALCVVALAQLAAARPLAGFVSTTFGAGSLIIPMDTSRQDNGMLRAYGLVYELLRNNVPVQWTISPSKSQNGTDFTVVSSGNSLVNFEDNAALTLPISYRGGPFVVAAGDAPAAAPIVAHWQAVAGDATVVHRLVSGSFTAFVERTLVRAPRIAILLDSNANIAFTNFNAAGIGDSVGSPWSASSPDLLTEGAVAGPIPAGSNDGVLLHQPSLAPRYAYLAAMHYDLTSNTPAVVREVRSWLDASAGVHAFMQCEAIRVFENDPAGLFISTLGIVADAATTDIPMVRVPAHSLAQIDGALDLDSGSVDSIRLASGMFKNGAQTLVNQGASLAQHIVLLTGRMDGDNANGRVTYFGGHDWTVALPVTANPQTNGVRIFLNSIFTTDVATDASEPDVTVAMSGPALIDTVGTAFTYTFQCTNPAGVRPAESIRLTYALPIGLAFVSASDGGTFASGVVTWDIPPIAPSTNVARTVTVNSSSESVYISHAELDFSHTSVRHVRSNAVTTAVGDIFCTGDGASPRCPCATVGATNHGCPNSAFTAGGRLSKFGNASISSDTLTLTSSFVPDGPGLFHQGSARTAGGTALVFGDGKLCVSGTILRLGVVFAMGATSTYPGGSTPAPIHVAGLTAAGDVRHYQLWYRDADVSYCTPATFNLTQGVSVLWTP